MTDLEKKLSSIHFSEMVPFYIMGYGFYEGHTSYRADPIAISFIFGLRNIVELEKAFKGKLYITLTNHFSKKITIAKKNMVTPNLKIQRLSSITNKDNYY